jgi:hypothetical protein
MGSSDRGAHQSGDLRVGGTDAVGRAVPMLVRLDPVADDAALAVLADRSHPLDGALEAVEDMHIALCVYFEGHLIVIAADFTPCHDERPVFLPSLA